MRILRVYLDTSVIGGCFDQEFSLWSNRLMDDFKNRRFLPVVSSLVATELEIAPGNVREQFERLLRLDLVRLEKIRIFNAVNLELGYKPLQIHSPREVATDE